MFYKNVRNSLGINLAFCKCLEYARGTAVYDLGIIKIKFVFVFHTVLRQKRVLVTCEDGSFMFFCSGSQCSRCLTDVKFFTVFTIDFIHDTS